MKIISFLMKIIAKYHLDKVRKNLTRDHRQIWLLILNRFKRINYNPPKIIRKVEIYVKIYTVVASIYSYLFEKALVRRWSLLYAMRYVLNLTCNKCNVVVFYRKDINIFYELLVSDLSSESCLNFHDFQCSKLLVLYVKRSDFSDYGPGLTVLCTKFTAKAPKIGLQT